MRIAYILSTFPCTSEAFILREIVALEKAGVRVIIFALRASSTGGSDEAAALMEDTVYRPSLLSAEIRRSVMFFLRPHPLLCLRLLLKTVYRNIFSPVLLLKLLRNLPTAAYFARTAAKMGADRVHAHFAFVPADLAAIVAELLDKPFSVSTHAWDIHTQSDAALRRRLAGASFVAACTERARARLAGLLPDTPVTTVYHGLRPDRFAPGAAQEPLILAVGRLVPKKGFDVLLEACSILQNRDRGFSCAIAGDGPERKRIERIIQRRALGSRVTLAGEVAGDALMNLYRRAAVFALPSVTDRSGDVDGLPNAILEAMAMRLPVVSTDASAAGEAIVDGENGFIVPAGNAEALADKMGILLKDGTMRGTMGAGGRKTVTERFDIDANIRELVRLFSGNAEAASSRFK